MKNDINKKNYRFTNDWFQNSKAIWDQLIPQINPTKILEIGSYEGASACYLIDKYSESNCIEMHCIDNWEGGLEHKIGGEAMTDMSSVEKNFLHNVTISKEHSKSEVSLHIHKGPSDLKLAEMLASGKKNYFDLIYIDGSHQAPDVLCDAILSFRLLRIGGVIIFDDYLWNEKLPYGVDPIRSPKLAIDAFTNIYCRKIKIIPSRLYQLYIQKIDH